MGIEDLLDWKGLRTKMAWAGMTVAMGALGYLVYPIGWTIQQDVNALKEYVISHEVYVKAVVAEAEEEREQAQKQLQKILDYIEKDYYIQGTGSVGTFGGDEPYVRVNRRSHAQIYKDGDRVRITCSDIEGKPETTLRVNGSFSNSNQDLVISFSKQAAADLGIIGRVEVELEPISEE